MNVEYSVRIRPWSPRDEPEYRPVHDSQAATELVAKLRADGFNAEPVRRHVHEWVRDREAAAALAKADCASVREIVRDFMEGEYDPAEVDDQLRFYTPAMGAPVRNYWLQELVSLLRLQDGLEPSAEPVQWLAERVDCATRILAGQLHPAQTR